MKNPSMLHQTPSSIQHNHIISFLTVWYYTIQPIPTQTAASTLAHTSCSRPPLRLAPFTSILGSTLLLLPGVLLLLLTLSLTSRSTGLGWERAAVAAAAPPAKT
jgi:hypothetical protein